MVICAEQGQLDVIGLSLAINFLCGLLPGAISVSDLREC
jgi:hypothetical protein